MTPSLSLGPRGRSLVAAVLALAMTLGGATGARASVRTHLASAKAQLVGLERNIAAEQARVASIASRLRTLAIELQQGRELYAETQGQLVRTQANLGVARARYGVLRGQLDSAAADAYIRGTSAGLEPILDPNSVGNLESMIGYVGLVMHQQADLVHDAHKAAAVLALEQRREIQLTSQRAAILARLTHEQNQLTRSFADQQVRLASLASARAQVAALVIRLRSLLDGAALAAAARAMSGGMPITFGKWAAAFLRSLHAPLTRNNFVVVVAWETAEYTDARWNPLATTYPEPGAGSYNYAGVRNYRSLAQGIRATISTLRASGFGYQRIISNLRGDASSMTTARAINASYWCHGCAGGQYVVGLIPTVERYYSRFK